MSDGALSQAEIDALLSGGSSAGAASPAANAGDTAAIGDFLKSTCGSQSSNLSMMTGSDVKFSGPVVSGTTRDAFLGTIPDTVTVVKVDFTAGFPGEHLFIMSEDTAKAIASLMNKEENIALDEMAMSVIGEVISQMVGTQITALTNKTGNKSIASGSPEAATVPKAAAALPSANFTLAAYDLDLGKGGDSKIWEVLGPAVTSGISGALSAPAPAPTPMSIPPLSSMGNNGMIGANPSGQIMGGGFGSSPAMQGVQFPNLATQPGNREQGNIGLLMDVFMEMTVELGRTKKLIKEILSMGEGTIIELDKLAGEPVDILVNHKLIAKGEVVVIDENFGVRVTEIVSPMERMSDIN
ncbi:MAG: flagellar motor switch protein FliN [Spirochaetaceae bacterium]|jgi:flagellar motor switch protein FliN/FliY|nr:flagellar motor switch protein FliN [Spirochaetaceae bacterium]